MSRDTAMLDMIHSFLQDAPQLVFQIFLLYRSPEIITGSNEFTSVSEFSSHISFFYIYILLKIMNINGECSREAPQSPCSVSSCPCRCSMWSVYSMWHVAVVYTPCPIQYHSSGPQTVQKSPITNFLPLASHRRPSVEDSVGSVCHLLVFGVLSGRTPTHSSQQESPQLLCHHHLFYLEGCYGGLQGHCYWVIRCNKCEFPPCDISIIVFNIT